MYGLNDVPEDPEQQVYDALHTNADLREVAEPWEEIFGS